MNALTVFSFEETGRKVRTVKIDGKVWFVGIDTCYLLGYKDPTTAMRSHCRGVLKLHPITDSLKRPQDTRIIDQADVLRLITGSTLLEAERIEAWIFEEVIPTVLKTGSYALPGLKPWKEPSAARLHELRMILREGSISVREFRRLAFNLDTPDVPDNPVKGALVFKTHDDFMEYAETHKKANPTVYSFAKTALKVTGNPDDFVLVRDLYRLYREHTNTWEAETRSKFTRRIKEMYPALEYKQKKVNGRPELVFTGCVLADL